MTDMILCEAELMLYGEGKQNSIQPPGFNMCAVAIEEREDVALRKQPDLPPIYLIGKVSPER